MMRQQTTFSTHSRLFGRVVKGLLLCLCWGISTLNAFAEGGLSLSQTRVIFNEQAKNAKVTLNNRSERVYLINSRVQATAEDSTGTLESVPFMVTPPLFRLEKETHNTVLILPNDTSVLPKDRESIYYLSFLAIPAVNKIAPSDTESLQPQLSVGIRSVIKLFYRPAGLSIPVKAAPEKLQFHQKGDQLSVKNPTPYYLTLAKLTVNQRPINARDTGAMLAPFSTQLYPVSEPVQKVEWAVIDDYGGITPVYQRTLISGEG